MSDNTRDNLITAFLIITMIVVGLLAGLACKAAPPNQGPVIDRPHHRSWNDRQNGLVFAPSTFPVAKVGKRGRVRVGVEGETQGRNGLLFVGCEIQF